MAACSEELTFNTHRRRSCAVALGFLTLYSVLDAARSVGWAAHVARATWILAVALAFLANSRSSPRLGDAAARLVGLVSGVSATILVHGYGGSSSLYFGFLLVVPFAVLVLVPDLPSSAALAGMATSVGGVVLLALDGRPHSDWVEWAALCAVINTLALWATGLYSRIRRREHQAELARTRAELDLRASEERFRAAFSSTSLGAIIADVRDGRVLAANAAVQEKLGFGDLTGKLYSELVAPGEAIEADAIRRALLAGGHAPRVERRYRTKSGQEMLAIVHASPVHDRDGTVSSAIIIVDDVTERRSLHARLAKSERLAALGTLAAGVAHEINNPLAYVKANLCWTREVLQEQAAIDRAEVSRVLDETERGAERIARIVAELSAYARGREEPAPTDVRRVIDDALRMASPRVGDGCLLEVSIAAELPPVSVVGRHLSQALLNLLANAVDAVEGRALREPRAARRIAVAAFEDAGAVAITVEDSGAGLPDDVRAHLFEPFFTTKGGCGTGLGLAISRENLSRFGATIEASESALGGARFCVRVPRALALEGTHLLSARNAA